MNVAQLKGQKLLFATKDAMIKIVPGGEFETNNRTVAATKLQENDMLLSVQPADGMREAVIQTTSGIFLRFPIEEISEMKKNAKGVTYRVAGGNPSAGWHRGRSDRYV